MLDRKKEINEAARAGMLADDFRAKRAELVKEYAFDDPELGIAPGTKFDDLPDDFVCPLCGVGKDIFIEE